MSGHVKWEDLKAATANRTTFRIRTARRKLTRKPIGFYVVYVAANGETINTSEIYTTRQAAQANIDLVQRNAPGAAVVDDTIG